LQRLQEQQQGLLQLVQLQQQAQWVQQTQFLV